MFTTITVENGKYRVTLEVANRVQYLKRCIMAFESYGRYESAEKCRQRIYDIMDVALFEKEAYEIDESEVA